MAVTDLASLTQHLLIVGEGNRDSEFLLALSAKHGLINNFQISSVKGNTTFDLMGAVTILPGYDTLPGILIFGDNDEKAWKSFKLIKDQLNDADLPSPPRPLRIARKQG